MACYYFSGAIPMVMVVQVTRVTGVLLILSEQHEYKTRPSFRAVTQRGFSSPCPEFGSSAASLLAICLRPRAGCAPS